MMMATMMMKKMMKKMMMKMMKCNRAMYTMSVQPCTASLNLMCAWDTPCPRLRMGTKLVYMYMGKKCGSKLVPKMQRRWYCDH